MPNVLIGYAKNGVLSFVVLGLLFVFSELIIRFIIPQQFMYPRGQIVPEYGYVLYKNVTVVHEQPGAWSYRYTHNRFGYRGRPIPISNIYDKKNVVILGDSNSYGMGVDDGEEYAAVMAEILSETHDVINLAVWGYGLSQQIRRFYEFGILYDPAIVVLQYSQNDLKDNLLYDVTSVEAGRFVFRDSRFGTSWIKQFLADSIIQKSQLYNLTKQVFFSIAEDRALLEIKASNPLSENQSDGVLSMEERLYSELLIAFSNDLKSRGITLVMISVNYQLEKAPGVANTVRRLNKDQMLNYVEIVPWFSLIAKKEFRSPQGHIWGVKGHKIIGDNLANVIAYLDEVNIPSALN